MSKTKLTVKEMTADYNRMAGELDLPIVKKLKPTKEFDTVKARWFDMCEKYNVHVVPEPTVLTPKPANRTPITNPTPKAAAVVAPSEFKQQMKKVVLDKQRNGTKAAKKAAASVGIKSTRPGTSIHLLIECVIAGGTVAELHNMMDGLWTENSIRAALAWDIPKKGYKVDSRMTTIDGKDMLFYRISNSTVVV